MYVLLCAEICYPVSEPAVYSQLQFYYPAPGLAPKSFAWLTSAGIYYGQVVCFLSLFFIFFFINFCILNVSALCSWLLVILK